MRKDPDEPQASKTRDLLGLDPQSEGGQAALRHALEISQGIRELPPLDPGLGPDAPFVLAGWWKNRG